MIRLLQRSAFGALPLLERLEAWEARRAMRRVLPALEEMLWQKAVIREMP